MPLKPDSIIFLLGAGASKEAGIPTSIEMIDRLESLLENDNTWDEYKQLYFCIKSSIIHGFGMMGNYDRNIINIETIVNTMEELIKSTEHPIYPFVGSWIPRLIELTNNDFTKITQLRDKIVNELYEWMKYQHDENITYYEGFLNFQYEYKNIVRIFSLNYDTCIEDSCAKGNINRGFDSNHRWDWRNFENEEKNDNNIVLYKLHGSRDWSMDSSNVVQETKSGIKNEGKALIFGTAYKMQYLDPFLYLIYEFRRRTLDPATKAIICIGYSFGDEHINGIIRQSIKDNPERTIIEVSPANDDLLDEKENMIMKKLKLETRRNIRLIPIGARNFLEELDVHFIEQYMPKEDIPF
jgi:hypothetical protein